MAADLYIHVVTDVMSEEDFKCFFANHIGSKWFNMDRDNDECKEPRYIHDDLDEWIRNHRLRATSSFACGHWDHIDDSPRVWVGEVSFLKAELLGDEEKYIPSVVRTVVEAFPNEIRMIDDAFIAELEKELGPLKPHHFYQTAEWHKIKKFLLEHKGKEAFTVAW